MIMNNVIKNIIMAIVTIVCLFLIIDGQKVAPSVTGLYKELIGLAGLLAVLFVYNRRYK